MKFTHENKGFTLVEILILVIILGILAAIVLPQFSCASPALGDNGFSEVADSQTDGNASDISHDQNASTPGDVATRHRADANQQFNSLNETLSTVNNPSHRIESASARTDESR